MVCRVQTRFLVRHFVFTPTHKVASHTFKETATLILFVLNFSNLLFMFSFPGRAIALLISLSEFEVTLLTGLSAPISKIRGKSVYTSLFDNLAKTMLVAKITIF